MHDNASERGGRFRFFFFALPDSSHFAIDPTLTRPSDIRFVDAISLIALLKTNYIRSVTPRLPIFDNDRRTFSR